MMAPTQARGSRRRQRFQERYGAWAVVTGASDGIGREIAVCLAESGIHLVLVARRGPVLQRLAADLRARHSIETRVVEADLASSQETSGLLLATQDLDVGLLAACAGFGTSGSLTEASIATELEMIDVNCRAVLLLAHGYGRRFAARGRGGIILMSSLVAFQGVPRAANYSATKAYVQTLAEGLHLELAPLGVSVLASAPGPVDSGFAARANMRMGMALTPASVARATLDALGRRVTVRPGLLSKLLEASLATLPRNFRTRMMARVMQGMTKHQDAQARSQVEGFE